MVDGCLDEHAALDYLAGTADRDAFADHLDRCGACRGLLLALARVERGSPGGATTIPARDSAHSFVPGDPPKRIGRFEIVEPLGAGAMGVVFRAEDPDLRRPVAIKVMKGAHTGDAARTRMLREAQAMAQLDHPNVIRIYEVGTERSGSVFIAMELVDGMTLGRWLREPRPWREIVDAFVQAGRGLAAAHAVGVVHRDFKPDNALVDHAGRVKVGDFGLARATSSTDPSDHHAGSPLTASMTQTGAVIGTPLYMSPEQLDGGPADARGDQFALCVALYDAVYGERPFVGAEIAELRAATLRGPHKPGKRGPASVLWPVLRRGLAPAPDDRFPDIDQLLAAIERALTPRRRGIVVGSATAAVLAGAVAVTLVVAGSEPVDPTARVWSPARAVTLREAMQRSQRPAAFVVDQTSRAIAGVDAWIVDWHVASAAVDADSADPEITRYRRACLDMRLRLLDGLIDRVSTARDASVDDIVPTLTSVRSPRTCTAAIRSPHTPPPPAGAEERLTTLSTEIDLAEYDPKTALATLRGLEAELRILAYAPLLAKVLYVRGIGHYMNDEHAESHAALVEAARLAPTAGDELLDVKIFVLLAHQAAGTSATLPRAHEWAGVAQAAVVRARSNPALARDEVDLAEMQLAHGLATIADAEADRQAALRHREHEVEMARRARGDHSRQYASALESHGRALSLSGDLERGRKQLEAAIAVRRELGPAHPSLADSLVLLADLKTVQAEYDAARADYENALAIATAAYGTERIERLDALNGLLKLDTIAGKYADALKRSSEIINLTRAASGDRSSALVEPLVVRATAQQRLGDLGAARASIDEARAIAEQAYGKDHPLVSACLITHGFIEMTAGNYGLARRELEGVFARIGDYEPTLVAFLGELDLIEGKHNDARLRFHKLGENVTARFGERHPTTGTALGGEGRALVALGKYREGLALLERAEAIAQEHHATGVHIGGMRVALSKAVFAVTKDRVRALVIAKAAREELLLELGQPGGRAALADVTAWIEKLGER